MSDVELRDCPFCGSKELLTEGDEWGGWVSCAHCPATVLDDGHSTAAELWNRRTAADRDALADALIAWAADEPRVTYTFDVRFEMCPLCEEPERAAYVGGLETDTEIDHAPDCLHERAKALTEEGE